MKRSEKAERVACFDVIPERRKAAEEKYGIESAETCEAILEREDIDDVLLVAPSLPNRAYGLDR